MEFRGRLVRLSGIRTARERWDPQPGRIEVRFAPGRYDWLQVRIRAYGRYARVAYLDEALSEVGYATYQARRQTLSCRMSAVFCPFPCLIRWLEAMTTGVQRCGFEWEAEGPDGFIGWERDAVTIRWPFRNKDERVLEVPAIRKQVVSAFYTAFRRFVESTEYDRERYEELRVGEILQIRAGRNFTEDEIRAQLLPMSAAKAESALQGIWTTPAPYIPGEWDGWSIARRREHLQEVFKPFDRSLGGSGTRLRDLRSVRVETWLESPTCGTV